MPVGLETPTTYCIFRSSVAIIIYNVQPTLIRIKNAELAKSFTTYFNAMWRVSTVI